MAIDISSGAGQFIGAANMGREQANYAGQVGRQKVEQVKGAIGSIAGTFGDMRKQEEAKKALDSWAAKVGFNVAPDDPIRQDPKLFTMGILNHVKENADEIARKHQSEMQGAGFENQKQIAQMGAGYDLARQSAGFENAATLQAKEQQASDEAKSRAAEEERARNARFGQVTAPERNGVRAGSFGINAPMAGGMPTMPSAGVPDLPTKGTILNRMSSGTPMSKDDRYDALKFARPEPKPRDPLDDAAKRAQMERDLAHGKLYGAQAQAAGQPTPAPAPRPMNARDEAAVREIEARMENAKQRSAQAIPPAVDRQIDVLKASLGRDPDANAPILQQINELLKPYLPGAQLAAAGGAEDPIAKARAELAKRKAQGQ